LEDSVLEYKNINTHEIKGINGQRLILFGAGAGCEEFLHHHKEKMLDSRIIAVTDNDPSYWGQKLFNYEIIPPAQIKSMPFDKIVVTTISGRETVSQQLNSMGLSYNQDYILIGRYPRTYIGNFKHFLKQCDAKSMLEGAHCLHIGPGGFLGFEILLYCLGAEKVYSIDNLPFDIHYPRITELGSDYKGVKDTLIEIIDDEDLLQNALIRYDSLFLQQNGHLLLDHHKIEFHHPEDVCSMNFEPNSFDLAISFSVLEHVEDPEAAVFEISRCLKPGGISFQTILTQDHRSFSKAADFGPFAYREYGPETWHRIAKNRFYQNRILPIEWRRMHEQSGLFINKYVVENMFELDRKTFDKFHSDFKSFSKQELREADCIIIGKKELN